MIPGQGYQRVCVSSAGYGAAGPTVSAQPELLTHLMRTQQRSGFEAYTNYMPPGAVVPMMIPLSPERNSPERSMPLSPATATYNSPSLDNFQKHGGNLEEESVTWWTDMRYQDQQWVQGRFETAKQTAFQGIRQADDVLLCQENDGSIHIFNHRVWSAKDRDSDRRPDPRCGTGCLRCC